MRDMLAVNALSKLQNIYSVIYVAKRSDFTEFIYFLQSYKDTRVMQGVVTTPAKPQL